MLQPDGNVLVNVIVLVRMTYVFGRNARQMHAFGMNNHGQCSVASREFGGQGGDNNNEAFTLCNHEGDCSVWTPTHVGGFEHNNNAVPIMSFASNLLLDVQNKDEK